MPNFEGIETCEEEVHGYHVTTVQAQSEDDAETLQSGAITLGWHKHIESVPYSFLFGMEDEEAEPA